MIVVHTYYYTMTTTHPMIYHHSHSHSSIRRYDPSIQKKIVDTGSHIFPCKAFFTELSLWNFLVVITCDSKTCCNEEEKNSDYFTTIFCSSSIIQKYDLSVSDYYTEKTFERQNINMCVVCTII